MKIAELTPLISYLGGKGFLLPEIRPHVPDLSSCVYFEPFIGAAAVLFDLQPEQAVINDSNVELMFMYNSVRFFPQQLIDLLKEHKERNCKEYYNMVRAWQMDRKAFAALPQVARAARMMYMSGVSFKGLYTVNTVGDMRACWGYRKNPVIYHEDRIWAAHEYLSSNPIKLMCGDYSRAIKDAVKGDFVYFDPPYHSDNKSAFTAYQARKFLAPEQQKLRDTYVELSERGVRCLFSNNDTKLIRNLFKDFEIISVTARRCFVNGDGLHSAKEVLVKNF